MVFGRILFEYHVSKRMGQASLEEFHRKWTKFKLFKIIDHQIFIQTFYKFEF